MQHVLAVDGQHRLGTTREKVAETFDQAEMMMMNFAGPEMLSYFAKLKALFESPDLSEQDQVSLIAVIDQSFSPEHVLGSTEIDGVRGYYYLESFVAKDASSFAKTIIVTSDELDRLDNLSMQSSQRFCAEDGRLYAISVPNDIVITPKTTNNDGVPVPFEWKNPCGGGWKVIGAIGDNGEIYSETDNEKQNNFLRDIAAILS